MTGCPSLQVAGIERGHFASEMMAKSKKSLPSARVRRRVAGAEEGALTPAEIIGQRVRQKRVLLDMTQKELAEKAGISQQNITSIERGLHDHSKYLVNVAQALGVSVEELQRGLRIGKTLIDASVAVPAPSNIITYHRLSDLPQTIPLVGVAAAGRWIEPALFDSGPDVPRAIHPAWGEYEQYALRVEGPSMNRKIPDGSIVVCTPYAIARSTPRKGDIVHAVMIRGQFEEWSIKELRIGDKGTIELWPDSTDHRFQTPFVFDPSTRTKIDDDETSLEIRGLAFSVMLTLA